MHVKLITVIGTRPQFVKASAFSRSIEKYNLSDDNQIIIDHTLIHTGQHYDTNMSEIFFDELGLSRPDILLKIKKENNTHAKMTAQIMIDLEPILLEKKPDYLIVYGDTNSTIAAALAASKLGIKIIHIEAGLRSFNKLMPEEINRILTDHISDILFCPTKESMRNLSDEGLSSKAEITGDIMLDVNNFYLEKAIKNFKYDKYLDSNSNFVLATIHRQETVDVKENLVEVLKAFEIISKSYYVIFPIHPRTRKMISQFQLDHMLKNLILINPVGYIEMLGLINNSTLVMTDSGGLQKEAIYNNKFCLIIRNETEWVEIVENNFGSITGYDSNSIIKSFSKFIKLDFNNTHNLYGNGMSANIMLNSIIQSFKKLKNI
jgi:UDP-GlcNAc3NAcA epimerase